MKTDKKGRPVIIQAAAVGIVLLAGADRTAAEDPNPERASAVACSEGAHIVNRTVSARDRRRDRDVDRIYRLFLSGRLSATLAARRIVDRSELATAKHGTTGVLFRKAGPDSTPEQEEKTAELMREILRLIRLRGELQDHMKQ